MANHHMEVSIVSRGRGSSIARAINYITGERIYDEYNGRSYGHKRENVLFSKIFLPDHAPPPTLISCFFPYTKEGIITLINRELCCDFTHMLLTEEIDIESNRTPLCGSL